MRVARIILSYFIIIRSVTFGNICLGKKDLVKQIQINDNYTLDYIQNLTCSITDAPKTHYKCKITCIKQQTCEAMRYEQSCELCGWTRHASNEVLDFNELYISDNTLGISQMIGKNKWLDDFKKHFISLFQINSIELITRDEITRRFKYTFQNVRLNVSMHLINTT